MDTQRLTGAMLDPLSVPDDRLFRLPLGVYQGMLEHGLLGGPDKDNVVLRDGLLVLETPPNGDPDPAGPLYRMPLDVYHKVANLGLLGPDDKVELLDGLLVKKMTRGNPHVGVTTLIQDALKGVLPAGWLVRKEDPIALPSGPKGHASVPEPDVAVVRGRVRDYMTRTPTPEDTALVVEVAESSLRDDRAKLTRYAWSGVPVAWLVDLNDRAVETHSGPSGPSASPGYRDVEVYADGDEIPVVVDGREVGRVAVADLLP